MADDVAQMHRLAVAGRDALQQAMPELAEVLTSAELARFVEFSSPTLPAPDHAILKSDAAAYLFANLREGLSPGAEGGIEDELALVAPWGVDLAGVRVPVSLWSGEQDTDTPAGHARWLATAIPGAELRLFPEEGHLSLVYRREREVLDWLAQQLAVTADLSTTAALFGVVVGVASEIDGRAPGVGAAIATSAGPCWAPVSAATPARPGAGGSPARSAAAARPLLRAQPPPAPTGTARARKTARKARATMASVTCRYHAG
jgi:hypothetical protein